MQGVEQRIYEVFDKEIIPVSAVAIGFTAGKLNPTAPAIRAEKVILSVEDDSIRWWADGSTPTATEGHLIAAGGMFELDGPETLKNFRAIRVTTDAQLMVSLMR